MEYKYLNNLLFKLFKRSLESSKVVGYNPFLADHLVYFNGEWKSVVQKLESEILLKSWFKNSNVL